MTFKFLLYRLLQSQALHILCLWAIILLWGYTGLVKLLDFESSHRAMRNQVFGNQAADVLVWLVPLAELLAAGLTAFARSRFAGLILSFFLMASFTLYILFVITNRFGRIPCSCGGIIETLSWEQHLLLNCFYLLIITYALLRQRLLFYSHGLTYQERRCGARN